MQTNPVTVDYRIKTRLNLVKFDQILVKFEKKVWSKMCPVLLLFSRMKIVCPVSTRTPIQLERALYWRRKASWKEQGNVTDLIQIFHLTIIIFMVKSD